MSLSNEQQYAFDRFIKGENLVITGPGGTGKSKLIQNFVNYCNSINVYFYNDCNPVFIKIF